MFIDKVSADDKNDTLKIVLSSIAVFLSRLPFLSAGYGVDNDSWRFASIARNIAVTGEYHYSRAPGHPLQEYLCSLLWQGGPLWLNGASAVMSVIAFVYFILILKELKFKDVYLPAIAFALTPIIYISSVNSMDNIWNLAFILPAFYYAMRNKPLAAAIMLGIANGSRLTSIVMILPLLIILYGKNYSSGGLKKNAGKFFSFIVTALIVTAVFYIPGLLKFGRGLFTDVAWAYPGAVFILFRMFLATWGLLGFLSIVTACVAELIRRIKTRSTLFIGGKENSPAAVFDKYFNWAVWLVIAVYTVIFLLMPHKPSYLVPLIPFAILLLGRFLNINIYRAVCVCIILSPFLFGVIRTGEGTEENFAPDVSAYSVSLNLSGGKITVDLLNGPIFIDHSKRVKQVEMTKKIISEGALLKNKSVIVSGESYPFIEIMLPYNIQGNVIYEYYLTDSLLNHYKTGGYDFYYVPNEDKANFDLYGINPKDHGGKNILHD